MSLPLVPVVAGIIEGVKEDFGYDSAFVNEVLADFNELGKYLEIAEDSFALDLTMQDHVNMVVTTLINIYL